MVTHMLKVRIHSTAKACTFPIDVLFNIIVNNVNLRGGDTLMDVFALFVEHHKWVALTIFARAYWISCH